MDQEVGCIIQLMRLVDHASDDCLREPGRLRLILPLQVLGLVTDRLIVSVRAAALPSLKINPKSLHQSQWMNRRMDWAWMA
jgi:hypothetical protein